ncbi:MAG: response regulator [Chloroflexaceae bacterium]|jgi:CheY-like chemotaxis protein|nr:response regulator [Chloroflexaceae bacterium]
MPYRVILVEDEQDVRDLLLRALKRIQPDATITTAQNGLEALQIFQQQGADFILSDHRMPMMSGLDLLRAVRQVSSVPFVLISADATVEVQARTEGVSDFLFKPVSVAQLRQVVQKYLP